MESIWATAELDRRSARMKPLMCRLGFHKYADLQRQDETLGQTALEECLRPECCAHRMVFRFLQHKNGPMHPRVEASWKAENEEYERTQDLFVAHEKHVRTNHALIEAAVRKVGFTERDMWAVLLQLEKDPAAILRPIQDNYYKEHLRAQALASTQGTEHVQLGQPLSDQDVQIAAYLLARGVRVSLDETPSYTLRSPVEQ